MKISRTHKFIMGACLVGCLCLIAIIAYWRLGGESKQSVPFDAQKWQRGNEKERGKMAEDLYSRKNGLLLGKTKVEIENLLGKPDSLNSESWSYSVDTGERFGSSPWFYDLTIWFDSQGKAIDAGFMD